ncbi:MAG: cyclic nucleotide-binding and patatin-like phospholipase domain-containing protein, partial [Gammaproteobacteria bacterium]
MDSSNRDDLILFISKTKLLNAVPASRIAELLSQLKQINLAKGDLLFSQGSLSDSVYILMKGKLCAYFLHPSKEPQIVGHIIQYETIGELGAISLEPRSLSVKAEVNSEVIEIPSNLFRNLCEEFPSILFSIVRPLVTRSLNTIKLLQPENKPEHVIIFSTERSINLLTFRQQIQDVIAANSNTKLVITSGTLNEQLGSDGSPDKSNKLYLTFIDEKTPPQVIEQLKHKTTNLYLVGDGTKNPAIDSFAAKLLDEDSSKYRIHLVLLYPEHHAALPVYTPAWKEKYNFFMHHHIHQNSTEDFQRMYRFFNGTPVGLVLGGGGVRGLAHFGVIKALLEKQIPIDVIGGSSVGAIAAFCYASSQNYAEAEQKFRAIFTSCYQTLSWRRLIWPLVSILSSSPATELTQEIFGNLLIENVWTNCFSVSSNLSTRKLHVHTQGLVWLAVRSSASTPGVFPPV